MRLNVGQDVFMRSGEVGNWGKVVEVTPEGVVVLSDPSYGAQLIRFDRTGVACDSSAIDIHKYEKVAVQYLKEIYGRTIDDYDIQHFWEDVERNQKHLGVGKIPSSHSGHPWKL